MCQAGVRCPHNFRFLYLNCVVGQGATGRSWHSASLHCQALLFPARHKPQRYAQAQCNFLPTARLLSKCASTARATVSKFKFNTWIRRGFKIRDSVASADRAKFLSSVTTILHFVDCGQTRSPLINYHERQVAATRTTRTWRLCITICLWQAGVRCLIKFYYFYFARSRGQGAGSKSPPDHKH